MGGSGDVCPVIVRERESRVLICKPVVMGARRSETRSGKSVNKMRSLSQKAGLHTSKTYHGEFCLNPLLVVMVDIYGMKKWKETTLLCRVGQ